MRRNLATTAQSTTAQSTTAQSTTAQSTTAQSAIALSMALLAACGPTRPAGSPTTTPASALHPDAVAMSAERWELSAREAEFGEHLGRPALRLRSGFAFLRDLELSEGILDFDMSAEPGTVFAGIGWHIRDEENFEKIYLRPFLSGSREATQYTPVFNNTNGWQLYHGPGYNQPVRFRRGEWLPVRVIVSGGRAELYIRDLETPRFTVAERRPDRSGRVALYVEPIPDAMGKAGVWFSNVRFTPATAPALRGTVPDETVAGRVPQWRVSETFASASLPADGSMPPVAGWTTLDAEPSGLLNLARAHRPDSTRDTALACATVRAQAAGSRRLRFGFSEQVRVWWNGRTLFDGDDTWHSRDITFQGVVGYYDAVWLPTEVGDNELCMAVTENVDMRGGWGLLAAFEDLDGLSLSAGAPSAPTGTVDGADDP